MRNYDDPFESPILKRLRFWKYQRDMRQMWEQEMEWKNREMEQRLKDLQVNRWKLWGSVDV